MPFFESDKEVFLSRPTGFATLPDSPDGIEDSFLHSFVTTFTLFDFILIVLLVALVWQYRKHQWEGREAWFKFSVLICPLLFVFQVVLANTQVDQIILSWFELFKIDDFCFRIFFFSVLYFCLLLVFRVRRVGEKT